MACARSLASLPHGQGDLRAVTGNKTVPQELATSQVLILIIDRNNS